MKNSNGIQWLTVVSVAAIGIFSFHAQAQTNAPPAAEKKPQWESIAALGFTLTRGNSETLLATLTAGTRKKWTKNELSLGADGTYGESTVNGQNTVNANSAHGFVQYNRLFTERFYGYARVDGMFDDVADIYYRAAVSPGVGYYLINKPTIDFSLEVGPAYIWENVGGEVKDYAAVRVGEKFHYKLSDRARFIQTAEWLPQATYLKNYIVNFLAGIDTDITADKKAILGVYLYDNYNNVPAPGFKCNDLKLVVALGYKF
jgi:putative salt-induced outer membrane protein YdiY